jgi:hypothetical protein
MQVFIQGITHYYGTMIELGPGVDEVDKEPHLIDVSHTVGRAEAVHYSCNCIEIENGLAHDSWLSGLCDPTFARLIWLLALGRACQSKV